MSSRERSAHYPSSPTYKAAPTQGPTGAGHFDKDPAAIFGHVGEYRRPVSARKTPLCRLVVSSGLPSRAVAAAINKTSSKRVSLSPADNEAKKYQHNKSPERKCYY